MKESREALLECVLSVGVTDRVLEEAGAAVPEEACGLLVGRIVDGSARVDHAVPCRNIAPEERRRERFLIDPRRLIEEERAGRGTGVEVVGFYHSHPEGEPVPSAFDRRFMELWPDVVWLIAGIGEPGPGAALRSWALGAGPGGELRELKTTFPIEGEEGEPAR